jgi:subtilase family serine protease
MFLGDHGDGGGGQSDTNDRADADSLYGVGGGGGGGGAIDVGRDVEERPDGNGHGGRGQQQQQWNVFAAPCVGRDTKPSCLADEKCHWMHSSCQNVGEHGGAHGNQPQQSQWGNRDYNGGDGGGGGGVQFGDKPPRYGEQQQYVCNVSKSARQHVSTSDNSTSARQHARRNGVYA